MVSDVSPNTTVYPVSYQAGATDITIGDMPLSQLIAQFGSPLYILDEATLRAMMRTYREAFAAYPQPVQFMYAAKANLNLGLCALIEEEGYGIDVVSGGEYYTALRAGADPFKLLFNGNNKTRDELTLAIHHGIGKISVDNLYELSLIDEIARQQEKVVDVILRITPGIECHTHDYIRTGSIDSKFGIPLAQLDSVIQKIVGQYSASIRLCGLHAHIGSQIFETEPFSDLVGVMLNLFNQIRADYGLTLTHLNLGGGLGIAYQSQDDPPAVTHYAQVMINALTTQAEKLNFPLPTLILEPGRSLVATAGVTAYTVGSIKSIEAIGKTYVAVDGGMGDNIRPALYGAEYTAIVANKAQEPHTKTVTLAGKYCESGDILIRDLNVPESIAPGDTIVVFDTGAYNASMASNYNRVPRPATVLVNRGHARVLVKRETYDDIIAHDLILSA